jgi:hypothetical protein
MVRDELSMITDPVMDCAELATAIRASAVHGALPVVLMTSLPSAVPPCASCTTRSSRSRLRQTCC